MLTNFLEANVNSFSINSKALIGISFESIQYQTGAHTLEVTVDYGYSLCLLMYAL
jgi:hypothetical protein